MKLKDLKYFIFILILSSFSCSHKSSDFNVDADPDSVIASEINSDKIVMLGENPHINVILYQSLIDVLNTWAIITKANSTVDNSLTLILEMDSADAHIIDTYIKTGNDSLMKEFITPYSYYETLEFYSKLRGFQTQLDSINNSTKFKIYFNIEGFEEIGRKLNLDTTWLMKNKRESELYFIKERDSITANNIIKYLYNQPNTKVLMFYGAGHLQYGLINKNYFDDLNEEQTKGYYLSYYLKKKYGEDNVLTVNQFTFEPSDLPNNLLGYYKGKSMLIVPNDVSEWNRPELYDIFVFKPFKVLKIHRFSFVFSNVVLGKLSNAVTTFEIFLPGYKASVGYWNSLSDIYFITGQKYKNSNELSNWIDKTKKDDRFERLDSKEFELEMYKLYNESLSNPAAKDILYEFGFEEKDLNQSSIDSIEWNNKVWVNVQPKIKFINAIGVYWIGYTDEKMKAKKYLIEFSGQDYDEPEKYLQWYRKNILGVNY